MAHNILSTRPVLPADEQTPVVRHRRQWAVHRLRRDRAGLPRLGVQIAADVGRRGGLDLLRPMARGCGGVGLLRGCNWARWLSSGWMGYHVVLSAFHSLSQLVTHSVLLVVIAYALFRPRACVYFQSARAEEPRS